jgi:type III secretion protein J
MHIMILWGLVTSWASAGMACQTRVQHGLVEREANRMVAALRQAGVEAQKVKEKGRGGKFAVQVPRGQVTRAIGVLLQHDLPRRSKPGFAEVFGKASLVPTATEQRARFLHALSGELTRTLESASGVLEARVHLVLPERHPLALREQVQAKPRAAVLLRVRAGKAPITALEVQRLVAGSVQELDPAQVAVVVRKTRPAPAVGATRKLAHVGPVSVSADSKTLLQAILGIGLFVILALSGLLVVLVLRGGRRLRQSVDASPDDDDEPSTESTSTGRSAGR